MSAHFLPNIARANLLSVEMLSIFWRLTVMFAFLQRKGLKPHWQEFKQLLAPELFGM
jgi:hypothetical protein